jgi:hypothetical protein
MGRFTDRVTLAKRVSRDPPPRVGPFERFQVPPELEPGKSSEAAFADGTYVVIAYHWVFGGADWVQLSVRRHDHKPLRDHWAVLMAIKDQILGPDAEAVELYPSRVRLVDVEHTYHLWSPVNDVFEFGFVPPVR